MRAWCLALLGIAGCGGGDGPGPHIDLIAPEMATVGTTVDVLGTDFCGDDVEVGDDESCPVTLSGFVTFGTTEGIVRADVDSWRSTRITVTVPQMAPGATSVVVTVNGLQSNAEPFEIQ
jgi:hypothetical protein